MEKKWFRFIVSAVSLVLSLALDLYYPDVKDVLCTNLPVRGLANRDNPDRLDRSLTDSPSADREK
jgi:hypothetical protein